MMTRSVRSLRRGALSLGFAALCLAALPMPARALNYIYVCLCCRPDGSTRYIHGWCETTCAWLNANVPAVVGCDTLFTALIIHPSSGVGDGFAPAFDRAVPLGGAVQDPGGTSPDVRIVSSYYPASDPFTPGAFATRFFAIRTTGGARAVNQYAAVDIAVTGLNPLGVCALNSSVVGGEPITNPFDGSPIGLVGTGDASIVIQTHDGGSPPTLIETRVIPIVFASLAWQDALALPPMCAGDCNRSGAVTFADVTTTLANFNHSYPLGVMMPGDANGDRVVNFSDVTTILANFGAVCGTTP
ncbi:MAG: hypothetical protein JNK58_01110 [Phycisphaerae bacterium]|nr:hypothetical protein [Phycisphaerae bacterium]